MKYPLLVAAVAVSLVGALALRRGDDRPHQEVVEHEKAADAADHEQRFHDFLATHHVVGKCVRVSSSEAAWYLVCSDGRVQRTTWEHYQVVDVPVIDPH